MSADWKFDVTENTLHLNGYMDAVGRVLTTDSELVSLSVGRLTQDEDVARRLNVSIESQSRVENWTKEFVHFTRDFLGLDDRQRLGVYLIDIICFFDDFTEGAICTKLDCRPVRPSVKALAAYVLELQGAQRVLLTAYRIDKAIKAHEPRAF